MRQIILTCLLGAGAVIAAGRLHAAEGALSQTQTSFDNWVRLQEAIAAEKRDWATEKEYLGEEIRLFKEEIAALEEREQALKTDTAKLEEELKKLETEEQNLTAAAKLVADRLPALEAELRELNRSFPASLQSTLESLIKRLPEADTKTAAGAAERMQVVVGLLSQVDKFNGQLSVAPEIRTNAAGEKIQVTVLYLGLAQAWFVSPDGKFAGHGKPDAGGWVWTEDDSLAPLVKRAIAINENTEVAAYVGLPASFK